MDQNESNKVESFTDQSIINGLKVQSLFDGQQMECVQGAFSRYGGVSKPPFDSHNISFGVGDNFDSVKSNRQAIKKYLKFDHLVSARQVHGNKVHVVNEPVDHDIRVDDCDALVTDIPRVGLLIGHADCQPVLLYDTVRKVVAAIHSGWRGSVVNIIAATISVMQQQFQTDPANLVAGVGPSLGPCCSEFVNHQSELPQSFQLFQVKENYFDFWQISNNQLEQCGVRKSSIFIAGICTSCSPDYFSYRRARRQGTGITGRNGTVIALL